MRQRSSDSCARATRWRQQYDIPAGRTIKRPVCIHEACSQRHWLFVCRLTHSFMADDLEQGVSGAAQACFTFLDGMLLRTKNAMSRRRSLPMIMIYIVLFALVGWWVGIQIHAYYIFKMYGLTWFENQLPSVSEVAGDVVTNPSQKIRNPFPRSQPAGSHCAAVVLQHAFARFLLHESALHHTMQLSPMFFILVSHAASSHSSQRARVKRKAAPLQPMAL
jgi:hypothetical protein